MKIIKKKVLKTGKWLSLNELTAVENGVHKKWESVKRRKCKGAVAVIGILKNVEKIILVKQYRPPADSIVIEFPAGLIDESESTEKAALRELKEETGYTGSIKSKTEKVYSSPGLSSETVQIILMQIDDQIPENQNPVSEQDYGENIETVTVSVKKLSEYLQKSIQNGCKIDAKVQSFALGLRFNSIFS